MPWTMRAPRQVVPQASRAAARPTAKTVTWRRWTLRAVKVALSLAVLGVFSALAVLFYFSRDLPDVSSLRSWNPPQTTRVLDRNEMLIGEIFEERRTLVPLDQIPKSVIWATLAAEDADFYQHEGLSYRGIFRAILKDIFSGRRLQGASTISQQVVKLHLLSLERTLERKVKELILTRRMEESLSKDEILYLYLNHINYGHGRYGIEEASRFYFGKSARELTLAEAALLAGIPQSPARLSPRTHRDAAMRRQAYVLTQLEDKREQYWPELSEEEVARARSADIELIPRNEDESDNGELMARVRRELRELVGDEAFSKGGYTVKTTIDLRVQRATRAAVRRGLEAVDGRQRYRAPFNRRGNWERRARVLEVGRSYDARVTHVSAENIEVDVAGHRGNLATASERFNPDSASGERLTRVGALLRVRVDAAGPVAEVSLDTGPQAAAVVLDVATRDLLAWVGSYEGGAGFDRAFQAVRAAGSTFKPFVFAAGYRARKFTPATLFVDAPVVYDEWRPQNYEAWEYQGAIRLRVALAQSINLVTVRAVDEVGPDAVLTMARDLGIAGEMEASRAIGLGPGGVRPIEMATAYATFASGGAYQPHRFLLEVRDSRGNVIDLPEQPAQRQVMTQAEAFLMTSTLRSVVTTGGTGAQASTLGREVAGKTGTSDDVRDVWFVGYSPRVAAAVWIGFDDMKSVGRRESGGRSALPIWIQIMRAADRGREGFVEPPGIVHASIDPRTGALAYEGQTDAIDEVFLEGTLPTEVARPPDVLDPSAYFMEQFAEDSNEAAGTTESPEAPAEAVP